MLHDIDHQERQREIETIDQKYACDCANPMPARRMLSSGVVTVWLQCPHCGRGIRSVKKSVYNVPQLPEYDEQKYNDWRARHNAERSAVWADLQERIQQTVAAREAQRQEQNQLWWSKYSEYLRSRQWHVLRNKVLERDGELCQACLTRKATQVHHLTYDLYNKLGSSAAFECVAICHLCHEKIHSDEAAAQHRMLSSGYSPYLNGALREY